MSLTIPPAQIVEESSSPLLAAPESWPRRPLGEVATILNGFAFKSNQFVPSGGKPLIRIRDIFSGHTAVGYTGDFDDRYLVKPGELLVGMDGDFNSAVWRGPEALLNQRVCKITPDPRHLDLDFLTFLLPGYLQAIHDATSSTTVTHLSSRDIARIPLPVPPLNEQRTLAQRLKATELKRDDASSHANSARRLIERFRQAVLAAACAGRLTADWREANSVTEPAQEVVRRAREAIAARSTRRGTSQPWSEPDWLELPESWQWAPMRDLALIKGGIQKQPKRLPKANPHPYLRVANVLRGRLDLSELHEFELFEGELETYRLARGDLLVVEGNGSATEIGRAATWRGEIGDCVHQNHIIRVRCVGMDPDFVELFWNSPIGSREIASLAVTSAGLYSLSTKKIGAVPVPVAPMAEQREIVRRASQLLAATENLASRIDHAGRDLDLSSQALLAKAFRGELTAQTGPSQ